MTKLILKFPVSTSDEETRARIESITKGAQSSSDPGTRALLYLRAAAGRATISLSAFYLYLAAESFTQEERKALTYAQQVKHYTLRFSAITTISLCLRAIFDHARIGLSAKAVTDASPVALAQVRRYWTARNKREPGDAKAALSFVQEVLRRCAVQINAAKRSSCILSRRVAIMKAYADREGAHISSDHYEYTALDVAHAVAATALLGSVIYHFDYPGGSGAEHLAKLDLAARDAALEVFPQKSGLGQLFGRDDLEHMLRNLYLGKKRSGAEYLSKWLPSALGLDGMPEKFFAAMTKSDNSTS